MDSRFRVSISFGGRGRASSESITVHNSSYCVVVCSSSLHSIQPRRQHRRCRRRDVYLVRHEKEQRNRINFWIHHLFSNRLECQYQGRVSSEQRSYRRSSPTPCLPSRPTWIAPSFSQSCELPSTVFTVMTTPRFITQLHYIIDMKHTRSY